MADAKVSDLTELAATPAADDELVVVDKSDTTQAASGTTKRLRADRLYSMPGNVTLGDDASDTLTVNSGIWTLGSNYVATRAAGALATGTVILRDEVQTFSGDAGGATNAIAQRTTATVSGANALALSEALRVGMTTSATAGATGTSRSLLGLQTLNNAGTVTNARIFDTAFTVSGAGGVTTGDHFVANAPVLSSTGAVTSLFGFRTGNLGHATLVTNAIGFQQADFTGAATLTVGYRSEMSSGTGKWGFQHNGTANNAFAGNTRIGSNVAPTVALDVTGSAAVSGDTTLGSDSSDTLTVNAGTWTLGSNYTATRAAGALGAGSSFLGTQNFTFSGDSGGTTSGTGLTISATASGSNALTAARTFLFGFTLSTTAGVTTNARVNHANLTVSDAGTATTAAIFEGAYVLSSSGGITTGQSFLAATPTLSSTGAFTTLVGYNTGNLGHATLVTNAIGFNQADFTGAASFTAGFRSLMTSGTGKWGFYSSGTANNAFAGNTRIGSVVAPTATLDVTGSAAVSGALTVAGGQVARVLASSGAQVADKGNVTSEQTFVTVTVPANVMGANGCIYVWTLWAHTNSANDKTTRVKFGGTNLQGVLTTTAVSTASLAQIQNRNATNSQIAGNALLSSGFGTSTVATPTAAIDTTADVTLLITGQKETGTETLTLERYLVELIPSA
jgi:hypothetical protein